MPWLFLRHGQTVDHANSMIQHLLDTAPAVRGLASFGDSPRPDADAFIRWTESEEVLLRGLFDDDPAGDLFDERYWRIRELSVDSSRPFALISSAIDHHKVRLQEMAKQLDTYKHVCGAPDSIVAVLDTNIYDQYQMFTQINWSDVLQAKRVRILVPLVVVDELDRQKDNRDGRLGKRAGKVIKAIRALPYVSGVSGPRLIRSGVELDFLPEPPGHVRRTSNDDEIVRQAAYLTSIAPERVRLVTGDLGMQVRAMNADVPHILLPDNLLATPEPDPQL